MARAGFAGSLIVHAGWKGKNLSRGLKNSQRETKKFGGMLKGLIGMTAGGIMAYAGLAHFKKFALLSSEGAQAWTDLGIAYSNAQAKLGKLFRPATVAVLTALTRAAEKFGEFLDVLQAMVPLIDVVVTRLQTLDVVQRALTDVVKSNLIEIGPQGGSSGTSLRENTVDRASRPRWPTAGQAAQP